MELVDYRVDDRVAIVRLNRPERLNAMSGQMRAELNEAWGNFIADDTAWVAVLTGAGRAFCAGRDIKEQVEAGGLRAGLAYGAASNLFGVPDTDKPLIAAVNGYAIGAGWYMTLGCDIRVAAESAVFGMGEVPTGLLGPYWFGPTDGIPWCIASELTLLGENIDARRALSIGLLNQVVPDDQLMDTAMSWAHRFLALPPQHVRRTKAMMRAMRPMPSAALLDREREAREFLNPLEDTTEAARAFVEKREPVFRGL